MRKSIADDGPAPPASPDAAPGGPGPATWALVTSLYVACVGVATYPHLLAMTEGLPGSLYDPLQHLWIVKFYKSCLLEWRPPVVSPELQFPVGAPLGNFSPLHFQALLFLPLSLVFDDVLAFNLIWLTGLVTTGLGTFLLVWHVLRDRRVAAFGGMLAMLSGPMLAHARGHLEIIFVGCFPLFLVAWMRLLEAPSRRRLAAAAAAYVLVALCAAYYIVFSIVPAALFAAWRGAGALRRREWSWLATRAAWAAGFCALVAPCLLLILGNQLWAMAHGYSIERPISEFNGYGAPAWTYFTPSTLHALGALLPIDVYRASGMSWDVGEKISYLGVVTILLIFHAAATDARPRHRGYWWALLATLVVLSIGSTWKLGAHEIPMPGLWLKERVGLFKMIRVPARFNLFAAVAAAVLAAAGLRRWLEATPRRAARVALLGGLGAVALLDLSNRPFPTVPIPPLPAAYDFIRRVDPGAGIVEVPQWTSGGSSLYSICGYWQSIHRLRTNAGYSGHANVRFDNLLTFNSPFQKTALARPGYLDDPGEAAFDIVRRVDALDYIWLYLHENRFRYVVLHEWPGSDEGEGGPARLERLKGLLDHARVFSEGGVTVYDREKLSPPRRVVPLTTTGWRIAWYGQTLRVAEREATLRVYNPDPDRPVKLVFEGSAFPRARTVRLTSEGRELARWRVEPGPLRLHLSPSLHLPAGAQTLVLESDGEARPRRDQRAAEWDDKPYSLRVSGLALIDAEEHDRQTADPPPQVAEQPAEEGSELRR